MNDLVLVPTLPAEKDSQGNIVLTKKFIEGVHEWARGWGGPVRLLMELVPGESDNLDRVSINSDEMPYDITIVDPTSPSIVPHLQGAAVIVGGAGHRQTGLPRFCRQAGVPFVYTTEYTLKTRLQIVRTSGVNPVIQLRRAYWEWSLEQRHKAVIRECAGVQCNGTPTYNAYRPLNANTLLFFDTRVRPDALIDRAALDARLKTLDAHGPLKMVFSGRLNRMKGADHLVPFAQKLRERGISFHLSICGDGMSVPQIKRDIERWGLERHVSLKGVLDFNTELLPFVKSCDLFVCCHRQGDPSCTYLETLSCGVPIIGYDNEAFVGVLEHVQAGRAVAMDDLDALADIVLKVSMNREKLKDWSIAGIEFAADHTFDASFTRRTEQLRAIAARPDMAA